MSAHTPGPWVVVNGWTGYPSHIAAPNADDTKPGAVGSHITRQGSVSLPSSEEGMANARLIAESPSLLDEVTKSLIEHQSVISFLQERSDAGESLNTWMEMTRYRIEGCRAARARATGGRSE